MLVANNFLTLKKYISKLGINSLIREAMHPRDPCSLSNMCYRWGGNPVASLVHHYMPSFSSFKTNTCSIPDRYACFFEYDDNLSGIFRL